MVMTRAQHKKMVGTGELEMGGLFEELIEEILNHIPIKPLIRMKCLSKRWYSLISRYRLSRLRTSTFKFLCLYMFCDKPEIEVIFLDGKEQCGEIESFENKSLSFFVNSDDLKFYGASNGLLLLSYYDCIGNEDISYVCNPALNQWVALPEECALGSDSNEGGMGMGLAFDGLPQDHYKVVCFALDRGTMTATGHLKCAIFSSDVCAWRKHKSVLLNSSLVRLWKKRITPHTQYLYRKGMIHWVLNVYMLVYHIQKGFFKLIELPNKNSGYFDEVLRLWESEGGLHISYNNKGKLHICAFVPDIIDPDGIAYMEADQFTHGKWQIKHILELATLRTQHSEILSLIPEDLIMCFKPCGFNEDLQVLYIRFPGVIVSYSFETNALKKVWTWASPESANLFFWQTLCMRLTGVGVPLGGNSKLLHPEKVSRGNVGRPLLLL